MTTSNETIWDRRYDQPIDPRVPASVPARASDVSPHDLQLSNSILGALDDLKHQLTHEHTQNIDAIDVMKDDVAKTQEEVRMMRQALAGAFPNGDGDAHRRYHESVLEWRELRNKMVRESLLQAAKVGGLGGIGWIAYAIWQAFKMEIHK